MTSTDTSMTTSPDDPANSSEVVIAAASELSRRFKLIFLTTVAFTVAFTAAWLSMAVLCQEKSPPALSDALNNCKALAISGFGAILGLFGAKMG